MRPLHLLTALIIAILGISLAGCTPRDEGNEAPDETTAQNESAEETQYEAAINLAKRAVLYILAYQEGDLAMFTARPETVEDMNVPEIPRQMNGLWWEIAWGTARLQPLPPTVMSDLQTVVNDLIAARVEEADEENNWVLITVGYDPDLIKTLIANAHTEWPPEEREVYLAGMLDSCMQVWCVYTGGEWKILAHLSCPSDLVPPRAPAPSEELIRQLTSPPPESTENTEEETDTATSEDEENPEETE
jgi:hypothetical protein